MAILNNLFNPLSNPINFPLDADEIPAPGFALWGTDNPDQAIANEKGQFIEFKLTT